MLVGVVVVACAWLASGVVAAALFTTRLRPPFDELAPAGFEPVEVVASDGVPIGAWLYRAERPRAAMVLVHGNGSCRTRLTELARGLGARGVTTMPITVRAHGDSGGAHNDLGWSARRDVIAAVARLAELEPGVPRFVEGTSLGAAATIFAAPALGDTVEGYVLVAPYADLELAVEHRTDRYLPPGLSMLAYGALLVGGRLVIPDLDRIDPATAARDVPRSARTLIVVGGADDRAPESDALAIARGLSDVRIEVLPGLDHEEVAPALDDRLDLLTDFLAE